MVWLSQLLLSLLPLFSHNSLLLLIGVLLIIVVRVETILIAFNANLLQKEDFVVRVGLVRKYDGDSVVDSHDCEKEDKEGT